MDEIMLPCPIEKVQHPLLEEFGIKLHVKREDLIHPEISGNKWHKLKYNLLKAKELGKETVITFGGAFSNHIYATAAASKLYGFKAVGIIRGEDDPGNPTLQFAKSCGMSLAFIDRKSYREKEKSEKVQATLNSFHNFYLIPEGGSNDLAFPGLAELCQQINRTKYDIVMVAAGTGGTATGILKNLAPSKKLWVFSSLKSDHLKQEILEKIDSSKHGQLKIFNDFHFGGYGKVTEPLVSFINDFSQLTGIPLDPIYNGKLMAGFIELIRRQEVDTSKSYLWIHTGGLQGIEAYNYMMEKKGLSSRVISVSK